MKRFTTSCSQLFLAFIKTVVIAGITLLSYCHAFIIDIFAYILQSRVACRRTLIEMKVLIRNNQATIVQLIEKTLSYQNTNTLPRVEHVKQYPQFVKNGKNKMERPFFFGSQQIDCIVKKA